MDKKRSVSTKLWNDPFVEDLNPTEKLLFIYLLTNPLTNILGVYEISLKRICYDTGINKDTVLKALKVFESHRKVYYEFGYIIFVNFLKNQKLNPNMKQGVVNCYDELPKELKDKILDNTSKGFESVSNGLLKYKREIESEIEEEIESPDLDVGKIYKGRHFYRDEFLEIWNNEYLALRKKKKAAYTERAIKERLDEIEKLCEGSYESALAILKKSVDSGWTSFYKLHKGFDNKESKKSDMELYYKSEKLDNFYNFYKNYQHLFLFKHPLTKAQMDEIKLKSDTETIKKLFFQIAEEKLNVNDSLYETFKSLL